MSHLRRDFAEIVRWLDDRVVKKGMRLLLSLGLAPKAFALLETAGWRTRLPRQTPVGNGLIGNTFWLIAARGEAAHYVRNLRHNPPYASRSVVPGGPASPKCSPTTTRTGALPTSSPTTAGYDVSTPGRWSLRSACWAPRHSSSASPSTRHE